MKQCNKIAGYTTRFLGSDYARLARALNIKLDQINSLKQIHSSNVVFVSNPIGQELLEGDALISKSDSIIGVRVADCLPLLIYDPMTGLKAAIHAGWKGLVSGVIQKTLEEFRKYHVDLTKCIASMGPCICHECFEVGPEVVSQFQGMFYNKLSDIVKPGSGDRSYINLKKSAEIILLNEGVIARNIEMTTECTHCSNLIWPSFRRGDKSIRTFCFI